MSPLFVTSRLTEEHDTSGFSCGKEKLDEWLRDVALRACSRDIARVYVWTAEGSKRVLAYYSLSPTQVDRAKDELTSGFTSGFTNIPGFLIGKLALDTSLHGRGLGQQLLLNALESALGAAEVGAGRLVVVDAIDDEAHAFYLANDFTSVKITPRRLVMKMATVRQILLGTKVVVDHNFSSALLIRGDVE